MQTYWIVALSLAYGLFAQTTTLINPATDGSFEGNHGWTLVNSPTYPDKWCIGSAAPPTQGSTCLYISDRSDCSLYQYSGTTGGTSYVHAYKEITIPAGQSFLTISFKAKLNANGFHRAIFYLMPSSLPLPQADVAIGNQYSLFDIHYSSTGGTADQDGYIVGYTDYTSVFHTTCAEAGQTYRFVITWRVDYAPAQPPVSIDELSVVSSATPSDPNLGGGVTNVSTLPYTHSSTPTPTTCGSGRDLFEFNVKDKCGTSEKFRRGEDRVWTFMPTSGGCVRVQFTGDTVSGSGWQDMNLLIYEDNPLSCGRCIRHSVNRRVHTHIFPVQAGRKYYVVLESDWGEGTSGCDDFLGLTISAPDSALCAASSLPFPDWGVSHFTVYPNPASSIAQVQATGLEGGRLAQLRVRDVLGHLLVEESIMPAQDGKFHYTLKLASFPAGLYTVEIQQGGNFAIQRLSIIP